MLVSVECYHYATNNKPLSGIIYDKSKRGGGEARVGEVKRAGGGWEGC